MVLDLFLTSHPDIVKNDQGAFDQVSGITIEFKKDRDADFGDASDQVQNFERYAPISTNVQECLKLFNQSFRYVGVGQWGTLIDSCSLSR